MNPTPEKPEISIVVTNWNGAAFLEECVSTLWASGEACGRPFELIVVDDVSSDGSPEMVELRFPRVRLLRNEKNMGFARTSNRGAEAARGRILVMMNNDMRVPEAFVRLLVAPFYEERSADETLFCVGAKTVDWHDGKPNHLCMRAAWRRGAIGQDWSDPPERCVTTYAQGGSAAFDRALYLRLNGFDPLFHPTYWDDYDTCYRAMKSGWTVLYEPLAVCDHLGKATLKRQASWNRIQRIVERNRLWFNWLNLGDPLLWCRHLAAIPWIYGRDLATGKGFNGVVGFVWALGGIPRVLRERWRRRRDDPPPVRSDRDLMGLSRQVAGTRE
ncbi:glycosyltransferase family 2 protein [Candidatus Sumerlaeota bacterium]|nr:glycosyltransferase family 2 protein [Candidatus Sumerlaeota bacterium]